MPSLEKLTVVRIAYSFFDERMRTYSTTGRWWSLAVQGVGAGDDVMPIALGLAATGVDGGAAGRVAVDRGGSGLSKRIHQMVLHGIPSF